MSRQLKSKKTVRRLRRDRHRKSSKRGGAVTMPLQYFGSDSGRYFAPADPKLAASSSAYGPFIEVSQGVPSLDGMVGPNVAPYQGASCTQTGGKRSRSKKSKSKSRSRSHSKKSKKSRSRSHSKKSKSRSRSHRK